MKNKKLLILIVCLVVAAGSIYSLYSNRQSRLADTTGMPTATVTRGNISLSITGTGNADPVRQQRLAPDITGKVEEIYFREGDVVKAGDLLYVLSNSDILLELESSRINLDNTMFDYQTTAEKIQNLEAKSPINGIIEELNIIEDETLSSGQAIAAIVDKSTLRIKAPLNSLQKDKVEVGQSASIFFASRFVNMTGTVVSTDQTGTPNVTEDQSGISRPDGSIFYYVHVTFENPGGFAEGEEGYVTINTPEGDVRAYSAGTVEYNDRRQITAPASAVVEKLLKKEKDHVAAGEVIALLSSDDLLLEQESKDVRIKQAQLEYQNKQQQIASLRVTAEMDGIVAGQDVGVGDEITGKSSSNSDSGSNSNTNINSGSLGYVLSSEKQITIPVDELDIAKIKPGQRTVVTIEALPGKTFNGTVSKISEIGNVQSGVSTYDVTVTIPEGQEIKSGMTADIEILIADKRDVLLVPVEAVIERNGNYFVMTGGQAGQDGEQRQVRVETGLRNENYVEITGGLEEGDEVILTGIGGAAAQNYSTPGAGGFAIPRGGGGGGMPVIRTNPGQGGR